MKFVIHRTGGGDIPEAEPGESYSWDRRVYKSPEEHDAHLGEHGRPWFSQGTDHGYWESETQSGIKRKMGPRSDTVIEVPDLAALLALAEKYGSIIVTYDGEGATPWLEIYDDYRE